MRFQISEPLSWEEEPEEIVDALKGTKVVLPCKARGFPSPSVNWISLNSEKSLKIVDSSLVLDPVSLSDSGRYQCTVANGQTDPLVKIVSLRVHGTLYI